MNGPGYYKPSKRAKQHRAKRRKATRALRQKRIIK